MIGRTRDSRGSVSIMVVAMLGVLLLIGAALGVVAAIVAAHRSAQAAADLAALAGAQAAQRGSDGCAAAAEVLLRPDLHLEGCQVEGQEVRVVVRARGPHWLGQTADLFAEARAGP